MLPYFNNKEDTDMIYLTHYLFKLYQEDDVRHMIKQTFWIEKLKNEQILEAIEGVIEYAIEEVEENVDDDFDIQEFENSNQLKQKEGKCSI